MRYGIKMDLKKCLRMLLCILVISSIIPATTALAGGSDAQSLNYVDLNNWTSFGDGIWIVEAGGRTVCQDKNGAPTFFLSPDDYINKVITGTIKVNTADDDDMIGFVMGYQQPVLNPDGTTYYDFTVFDWKQSEQTESSTAYEPEIPKTSAEGYTLGTLTGVMNNNTYFGGLGSWSKYFWFHVPEAGKFNILGTKYSPDEGWADFKEYQFKILYASDRIRIMIDNEEIFNVTGSFKNGKFGFYNSSQSDVIYGNVQSASGTTASAAPVAQDDRFGMVKSIGSLTIDKFNGILANDYDPNIDNFSITIEDGVSVGNSLSLNQDGSFTYTPFAGFTGIDTFTYFLTDENGLQSESAAVDIVVMEEANEAPTGITLDNNIVEMGVSNGSMVGTLSTSDPNGVDAHDYMLISNAGGRFGIIDDKIIINDSSLLTPGNHSITVQTTDLLGLSCTQSFTITVQYPPRTLTYMSGGNGSITGSTSQIVPHGGDGSAVTAIPLPGYHFDRWSDGKLTPQRTDTNVTANISVTALFTMNSPAAGTNAAGNITSTAATLNGVVNANDTNTTVTFEYGLNMSYGLSVTAVQSPVSGSGDTAVSASVAGLTPNTIYHYRVKCVNGGGTSYGEDSTFTTLQTALQPAADVIIKNGTIKKDAVITLSSEPGAKIYYTAALNGSTPDVPTTSAPFVLDGGAINCPELSFGDVLNIKAIASVPGKDDSQISSFNFTVQPKNTLTVTGASAVSRDYDGTRNVEVAGGTINGTIIDGDDVSLVSDAVAGQFADKNAQSGKSVTVSGYTLAGADAQYYELVQPALTANINVKSISVSGVVINDKIYDGSKSAAISSVSLSWKAVGDDVYVRIPAASAEFSDAGISNNAEVSVTGLELTGDDAGNYQLAATTFTTTGNIIPAGTVSAPTVNPADQNIFSGANITLSTATEGATIYYTLDGSEPAGDSSTYTAPISLTGETGDVITVKAMAKKVGMTDSGVMNKEYTIVPPGTFNAAAVPDNQTVTLSWDAVDNTSAYQVYKGEDYLGNGISVGEGVFGYTAADLTNGAEYTFRVNALDAQNCITHVAAVSATPRTAAGAPTDISATAGDGLAVVTFVAPEDNGGSEITGYNITSSPGNITVSNAVSPATVTGLTNGITYTFTVIAVNAAGNGPASAESNTVTPYRPSDEDSYVPTPKPAPEPARSAVEILVNGNSEAAATQTIEKIEDKIVTTVIIDDKKVEDKLQQGLVNQAVTIQVKEDTDVVLGQINGQTVKNMEISEAVLEVKTGNVTYLLPAAQINIDNVSNQIGSQVELKDIKVNVKIAEPPEDTVRMVEDTAAKNSYQLVVKPVDFEITCTSEEKSVEVSRFNGYVERTVQVPDGIDPARITTGIVLNPDGTFSHVPTTILVIDGKHYAKINSLTNSTYSVIWSPKNFTDAENHWAKDDVNDVSSRLIVDAPADDKFEPDMYMTRAEFAAVVIKALGLMRPGTGKDVFSDVAKDSLYYDAVSIAYDYGIISGYENGKFGAMDDTTREQAMAMVARAMKLTGLKAEIETGGAVSYLSKFVDAGKSADWAEESIDACVKTGIIMGGSGKMLAPDDRITRAEAAAIIRRLLQKSNLI